LRNGYFTQWEIQFATEVYEIKRKKMEQNRTEGNKRIVQIELNCRPWHVSDVAEKNN
jgi:hypothetical protein